MGRAPISAAGEENVLNGPGGAAARNEQNSTTWSYIWNDIKTNTASASKSLAQLVEHFVFGRDTTVEPISTQQGPMVKNGNPTGSAYKAASPQTIIH